MIWTMAVVSGISHAKQAASADYYRQFHLYFLKGEQGSELDSTAQLRPQFEAMSWNKNFWSKLTAWGYLGYTAQQEAFSPSMQRLRAVLRERYGTAEAIPMEFRQWFRQQSLPLMKYTNMLSFNTRTIAMFISVIINVPWLYFAFEIVVLNLMLVYMTLRHEAICRRAIARLSASE